MLDLFAMAALEQIDTVPIWKYFPVKYIYLLHFDSSSDFAAA